MIGLVFDECEYDWANWCDKAPILLWLPSICPSRPVPSRLLLRLLRLGKQSEAEKGRKRKRKKKSFPKLPACRH